jgi:hypothetical protein
MEKITVKCLAPLKTRKNNKGKRNMRRWRMRKRSDLSGET